MNYKLTVSESGNVEFVMPAGSEFVRSNMPEGKAIGIIESSDKIEKSDKFDGFGIKVDDGEYYIAGIIEADEPKEEKFVDESKNDKNFKNKWKK